MRNVARDKIIGLHRNGRQEKEKCKIVTGYLLLVLFDEIEAPVEPLQRRASL
jgi:hypothetical protein